MKALPVPDLSSCGLFDAITAVKQEPRKALLVACRLDVFGSYGEFQECKREVQLTSKPAFGAATIEALQHCYDGKTVPRNKAVDDILSATADCPYCGLNEGTTLDHYLPKEGWPALSVYTENLVPSCFDCNNIKGTTFLTANGHRKYFSPYFDTELFEPVYFAGIQFQGDLAFFSLGTLPGVPEVYAAHVDSLELEERTRQFVLLEIPVIARACARLLGVLGAAGVADQLIETANDLQDSYGPNNWRTLLHRALAADAQFCSAGCLAF